MIARTFNTRYELKDAGDGAVLVQGHPKYCPTWRRFRPVYPICVGAPLVLEFDPRVPEFKRYFETTPVVEITDPITEIVEHE